jgi:hypothetical protein
VPALRGGGRGALSTRTARPLTGAAVGTTLPLVETVIDAGGIRLAAQRRPAAVEHGGGGRPGLVVCHGFPAGAKGAAGVGRRPIRSWPDRIASDAGWTVLAFNFRGTGDSEGDFSRGGWLTDLRAAVGHLLDNEGVGACGSWVRARVAPSPSAQPARTSGCVAWPALSARADFDDWAGPPSPLPRPRREIGVIRDTASPKTCDAWTRELREAGRRLVASSPPARCCSSRARTTTWCRRSTPARCRLPRPPSCGSSRAAPPPAPRPRAVAVLLGGSSARRPPPGLTLTRPPRRAGELGQGEDGLVGDDEPVEQLERPRRADQRPPRPRWPRPALAAVIADRHEDEPRDAIAEGCHGGRGPGARPAGSARGRGRRRPRGGAPGWRPQRSRSARGWSRLTSSSVRMTSMASSGTSGGEGCGWPWPPPGIAVRLGEAGAQTRGGVRRRPSRGSATAPWWGGPGWVAQSVLALPPPSWPASTP